MYGANQTSGQETATSQSGENERIRSNMGHRKNRRKSQNQPQTPTKLANTQDKGIGEKVT